LATSVEQSVVRVMPGIFRADLVVGSLLVGSGYVEAPGDEGLVEEIAPVAGEQVSDWEYRGGPIAINAFDASFFTDGGWERWPLVGTAAPAWADVAAGRLVIVSTNFAHNLDVGVGDSLDLDSPSGRVTVRVGALTHDFLSPRGSILMSRELYRSRWKDTHVTHALVRVAPGADVARVRAEIARAVGGKYTLRILSVGELVDWFTAQVRRAFSAIDALGVMVLLVVALGVADTVAAGVVERRRELAAMNAFGMRRAALARMIVVEASFLALGGVALAISAGLVLGVLWVDVTFPDLVGWVLELHVPLRALAGIAAVTVAICVGAAAVPAFRSARLRVAEALRYD